VFDMSNRSVILPIVPMFHANSWGIPFAAATVGAKLVFSATNDAQVLCELMHAEGVTHSAGVPTVWLAMFAHMDATGIDYGKLYRVIIGGSAAPRAMIERFMKAGIDVGHAWGMTETSPIGTMGKRPWNWDEMSFDERVDIVCRQGCPPFGVELRIVDEEDNVLPRDGVTSGRLQCRGPWIIQRYFKADADAADADGWFDTGDVSVIHPDGVMQITDRAKDVIKSGGEWISSIELENAGIDARIALPIGGLIWTLIRGRFDLRNHRKQLIIDNRIAWCGSQNLADPEFRIKSKYAPWVDIMTRWEGPVVQGCQFVFAADWESERGDDIGDLLQDDAEPPAAADPGIAAQVIATGPNVRYAAMTACFTALIHSARRELVVTTPYFVPDEQLLFALLDCARRGVATVMIVPHRNDSRVVAGASRSYYADLVDAGVKLYEYRPGLLHAKTMVVDGEVALIGSANLDRRSFELNFENNILLRDKAFAAELRTRQEVYRADSIPASAADVASFGIVRRLWQNLVATVSPLL
jgi:hypothetical protein